MIQSCLSTHEPITQHMQITYMFIYDETYWLPSGALLSCISFASILRVKTSQVSVEEKSETSNSLFVKDWRCLVQLSCCYTACVHVFRAHGTEGWGWIPSLAKQPIYHVLSLTVVLMVLYCIIFRDCCHSWVFIEGMVSKSKRIWDAFFFHRDKLVQVAVVVFTKMYTTKYL